MDLFYYGCEAWSLGNKAFRKIFEHMKDKVGSLKNNNLC
jgi:hypothetical protein